MDPSKVKKEPPSSAPPSVTSSAQGGSQTPNRLSSIRRGGKPAFAPKLGAAASGTPPPQAKVKKEPGRGGRKPREQRGRGGRGRGRGGRDRASAPAPRPPKKPEAVTAVEGEQPKLVKHNDRFDESKEPGTYPVSVPFLAPDTLDMNNDNLGAFLARADADTMMFMQLPSVLPIVQDESTQPLPVRDLPSGYIGKLLVYRSGKVKMKLGNILFDVSIGTPSTSLQHVAYISPEEQKALVLGTIKQRTIVTPSIDDLLSPEAASEQEEEAWDEMEDDTPTTFD